jgi:hypothetical protein
MWSRSGVVLLFVVAMVGCSSDNTTTRVAELNSANIQKVANLYMAYQQHHGPGPKDAAALKEFITRENGLSPHRLELMHIDPSNLDQIFTSERDHKPFKIKPSVVPQFPARSAVVFEDTGVDNKRMVGFNNSDVLEVDEAKYKGLWESKDSAAEAAADPEAAAAAAAARKGS